MSVPLRLAEEVRSRARGRCEYCKMAQSLQDGSFHIEHVILRSRGGTDSAENLALACPGCNLHERQAAVIELRFIGGVTIGEAASALGVSTDTVEDDTVVARGWLRRKLRER